MANKRRWLIIGGVVGVLLIVVFIWWQQASWAGYQARITENHQLAGQSTEQLLGAETVTVQNLQTIQLQLSESSDQSCQLDWWQRWRASLSEEPQQIVDNCQQTSRDSQTAAQAIDKLLTRIDSEATLTQVIDDTVRAISKLDSAKYDDAIKLWQQAADKLEASQTDSSLQSIKDQLLKAAQSIIKAYQSLKTADNAESRPKYDDASVDLSRAYQATQALANDSRDSYHELTVEVIESLQAVARH